MNTAGRTVLGEPHLAEAKVEHRTHISPLPSFEDVSLKETFSGFSPKTMAFSLLAIVLVWGAWYLWNLPPEGLEERTRTTAERFAADDLAYLKNIATSDTIDDVVRWFDAAHPSYVKLREEWKTPTTEVRVMVIDENRRQRTGEAQAYIYPAQSSHTAKIANEASASAPTSQSAMQPVELKLYWVLDVQGRWRLNGRQTYGAAASQITAPMQ